MNVGDKRRAKEVANTRDRTKLLDK